MRLFILTNPSPKIKGYISQFAKEVSCNVFLLMGTRKDADAIYDYVLGLSLPEKFSILLAQPDPSNEWGYSIRAYG